MRLIFDGLEVEDAKVLLSCIDIDVKHLKTALEQNTSTNTDMAHLLGKCSEFLKTLMHQSSKNRGLARAIDETLDAIDETLEEQHQPPIQEVCKCGGKTWYSRSIKSRVCATCQQVISTEGRVSELKPCPFCGGQVGNIEPYMYHDYSYAGSVTCMVCGYSIAYRGDFVERIWNKREDNNDVVPLPIALGCPCIGCGKASQDECRKCVEKKQQTLRSDGLNGN